MRTSPHLLLLALVALGSAACVPFPGQKGPQLTCATASADTTGWNRVTDVSGFSFLLPPGFRENHVEPIDSHVRGFEADGLTLSLDYGGYSKDLTGPHEASEGHLECPAQIGGRDALIVLTWPDRIAYDVDGAWRNVRPGMHLWMGGAANTPNGQRALLTVLRSVRFNEP